MTVTDKDGDSDVSTFEYIVVYDPNGRFVTGGGWINSPDWQVIAGSKAQYKDTGTINGTGEYKFMLTAIDNAPDKFRIRFGIQSQVILSMTTCTD
jgi:hypothetical protein